MRLHQAAFIAALVLTGCGKDAGSAGAAATGGGSGGASGGASGGTGGTGGTGGSAGASGGASGGGSGGASGGTGGSGGSGGGTGGSAGASGGSGGSTGGTGGANGGSGGAGAGGTGGSGGASCTTTTVLATGQVQPFGVAVDATHVYWVNHASGTTASGAVMRVAKSGGGAQTLAAGQSMPWSVAVDSTHAYWTNWSSLGTFGNSVMRVPIAGGAPEVFSQPAGQIHPFDIALDATHVFWTAATGQVWKAPKSNGATPQALVTGAKNATGIAVDTTHVFWTEVGSNTTGATDGLLGKVAKDGSGKQTLVSGFGWLGKLALDATAAFYVVTFDASGKGPSVRRVDKAGTNGKILQQPAASPAIAVDAAGVYIVEQAGNLKRMQKDGSGLVTLASGLGDLRGLALDAGAAYVTDFNGGKVLCVPK